MIRLLAAALALTLTLALARPAAAQSDAPPRTFGFSGVLDQDGAPAEGSVALSVRLFEVEADGAPVYAESHPSVSLVEGVFSIAVGGGDATLGRYDDVAFDRALWVEIEVEGETLAPRTQLLAAPFAASVAGLRIIPSEVDTASVVLGDASNSVVPEDGASRRSQLFGPPGAVVGGGTRNRASGPYSVVAGGSGNQALAVSSTVSGGTGNDADGVLATVSGGLSNVAEGEISTISGGEYNQAAGKGAAISGGGFNTARGLHSAVPGGLRNDAGGAFSVAAGRYAYVRDADETDDADGDEGTFVWSDALATFDAPFVSTGPNQFLIRARGGVGIQTNAPTSPLTVLGDVEIDGEESGLIFPDGTRQTTAAAGVSNVWLLGGNPGTTGDFLGTTNGLPLELRAGGLHAIRFLPTADADDAPAIVGGFSGNRTSNAAVGATISGGGAADAINEVRGQYSSIGGGVQNLVAGDFGTVAGGSNNSTQGIAGTIGGGIGNAASGSATVSGGNSNTASGSNATVSGGNSNVAGGAFSVVPGGAANRAGADYSFAAGYRARVRTQAETGGAFGDRSTFVWADFEEADFVSTAPNQFLVRARGGVGINTNALTPSAAMTVAGEIHATAGGIRFPDGSLQTSAASGSGGGTSGWALGGNAAAAGNFIGTTNSVPLELRAGNLTAARFFAPANANDAGALALGYSGNVATGTGATVSGGGSASAGGLGGANQATGDYAVVGGGVENQAGGERSIVAGGGLNEATGEGATVSGGSVNTASGEFSAVSGGGDNTAGGNGATVGGGLGNEASGLSAAVAGGSSNTASGFGATVGGGFKNEASGEAAAVAGGSGNTAGGDYSTAGGRYARVRTAAQSGDADGDEGTFVWSDALGSSIDPFASTGANQFLVRARGGVGINTNAPTSPLTVNGDVEIDGSGAALVFPDGTRQTTAAAGGASGWSLVGNAISQTDVLGTTNDVPLTLITDNVQALQLELPEAGEGGFPNVIGGGVQSMNISGSSYGLTAFGSNHTVDGIHVTATGGFANTASATLATVLGGTGNQATGISSTVVGGADNEALGESSFAAGTGSEAAHDGAFVWTDLSAPGVGFGSSGPNQFNVRAAGGTRIFSDSNASTGVLLTSGAGSWTSASSVHLKTGFSPIAPQTVLAGVLGLDIQTWRYRSETEAVMHLGPTSQDFAATFGLGATDEGIATVDADGVALAAIQGLHELIQAQAEEIARLRADIEALRADR